MYIQKHTHEDSPKHTLIRTLTHIARPTHKHAFTLTSTQIYERTLTHLHINTHNYIYIHKHMHTHKQALKQKFTPI